MEIHKMNETEKNNKRFEISDFEQRNRRFKSLHKPKKIEVDKNNFETEKMSKLRAKIEKFQTLTFKLFFVTPIPILKSSSIFPEKVFSKSSGFCCFCDWDICSPPNSS